MNRLPRLLPLVAVAIGGVVSLKALSSVEAFPQALAGARAWAEEAPKAVAAAKPKAPAVPETVTAASIPAAKPVAACAPTAAQLARDAGLSPAELQVLQSLGQRRGQLDAREQELDTQLQLLAAAEAKLDAKLRALNGLKGEIQGLVGQADEKEKAEVSRLVTVYSKMKPRDAAMIMSQLDDSVRVPVAAQMKEAGLAAILGQMPTTEAKKLTELLAKRFDKAQAQAKSLASAAAAADVPAAGPAKTAAAPGALAKPAA